MNRRIGYALTGATAALLFGAAVLNAGSRSESVRLLDPSLPTVDLAELVTSQATNERRWSVDETHTVRIRYPDPCEAGVRRLGEFVAEAASGAVTRFPTRSREGTLTLFVLENRDSPPNFRWEHRAQRGSTGYLLMPQTCQDDSWDTHPDVLGAVTVALHEFVHAQVHSDPRWNRSPAWIVEGFASFVSIRAAEPLPNDYFTGQMIERLPLVRYLEQDSESISRAAAIRTGRSAGTELAGAFIRETRTQDLFHGMFLAMSLAGDDPAEFVARYERRLTSGAQRQARRVADDTLARLLARRASTRTATIEHEHEILASTTSPARRLLARVRIAALDRCTEDVFDGATVNPCAEPLEFALLARCAEPDALVAVLATMRTDCADRFDLAYSLSADALAGSESVPAARQALDVIERRTSPLSRQYAALVLTGITTLGTEYDAFAPGRKQDRAVTAWRRWLAEAEGPAAGRPE